MKITKSQLKRIIKEETKIISEAHIDAYGNTGIGGDGALLNDAVEKIEAILNDLTTQGIPSEDLKAILEDLLADIDFGNVGV